MASKLPQLHFILFPFMAPGHMVPMVDIGRILAQQGMMVSIVTTPLNAKRYAYTVAHAADSGLQIKFIEVPFPSEEAALPGHYENLDMIPSLGLGKPFLDATFIMQEPVERLFEELTPRPNCIISDMLLPYTGNLATKFGIPRISFNGFSAFCMLCLHKLQIHHNVLETVSSESEPFVVPDLPDHIELTIDQMPQTMAKFGEFAEKTYVAEMVNFGFIINSFDELETAYIQEFIKARPYKVWRIGPVSLCNTGYLDKVHRGNKASIDEHECLEWLNSQKPGSVIYACLGSICNMTCSQLIELGLGLEASNRPFIWVVRDGETTKQLEKWFAEVGFEERIKGRGLIIRGWAPQILILEHAAVGGFLMHCGWNSVLEGISASKPMVTWPLFGDQFSNEKFVVQVLKIGVGVGSKVTLRWGEEDKDGVLVKGEDVKKAIDQVMDDGMEGEERRRRVQELSKKAKKAMTEEGSSYLNVRSLIEDILQQAC